MAHSSALLNFPGKESDEQIYIFVRRYPVAFLPTFILLVGVTLLGLGLVALLGLEGYVSRNYQVLVGSAFILFMLLFALIEFIDFYFDLHILTDRRLVDINQLKLFNRSVSTLLLDDIQDVTSKSKGPFETLFNFGDVEIQTAGATPNFVFNDVKNPDVIAAMILDLSDQTQQGIAVADRHPEGPVAAIMFDETFPHTADHQNEGVPVN